MSGRSSVGGPYSVSEGRVHGDSDFHSTFNQVSGTGTRDDGPRCITHPRVRTPSHPGSSTPIYVPTSFVVSVLGRGNPSPTGGHGGPWTGATSEGLDPRRPRVHLRTKKTSFTESRTRVLSRLHGLFGRPRGSLNKGLLSPSVLLVQPPRLSYDRTHGTTHLPLLEIKFLEETEEVGDPRNVCTLPSRVRTGLGLWGPKDRGPKLCRGQDSG